ncbi:MAG: S41 family peptidase, partial [Patescibacteria group bacterium]
LCRMRDSKTEETVTVERSFFQPYLSERDIPVAVLIDGFSASGSEILAAAMQEHGRATLVGEKTAVVVDAANLIVLPDGAGMNVTVERIITPKGVALGQVGVTPDVIVPANDQDYVLARDSQLFRALEIIKSKIK